MKYFEFGKDQKELMVILMAAALHTAAPNLPPDSLGRSIMWFSSPMTDSILPSRIRNSSRPWTKPDALATTSSNTTTEKSTFSTEYPMDAASSWRFWATTA